ncbi:hypothetical protein OG225_41370 (plasmid) [Nocardia sp. NBC_01377]|uniref:hypothetical protein n=1 Tax=Nocardia sp. NBC_01377 TaxID=2903595 RepID=UPI002F919640
MSSDSNDFRNAQLDDLVASITDDDRSPMPIEPEFLAAGDRIADRLTGQWARRSTREATVTALSHRARGVRVPGFTAEIRAAASDTAGPVQRICDRELGIEFRRSSPDGHATSIDVTAHSDRASAGDIVSIQVTGATQRTELLVVLHEKQQGTLTGQIVTSQITLSDDLQVAVVESSTLTAEHASAVTAAVRNSPTAGRNAWRSIARQLPATHPVRAAVINGLR